MKLVVPGTDQEDLEGRSVLGREKAGKPDFRSIKIKMCEEGAGEMA